LGLGGASCPAVSIKRVDREEALKEERLVGLLFSA
jgi:hypothetical protein